jgi:putative toxin-antitoxin system antitoxin component (TIGR02293 family)
MRDEPGLTGSNERKSTLRHRTVFSKKGLSRNSYMLLLGLKVGQTPELLERIKKGLGYNSWECFIRNTDLRKEDATNLVQISPRTLSRRKEEGRLHPDESDRLIRAARIFALTSELFDGNVDSARKWLTAAQPALGGSTPIEYASTDVGAREVESLIGRLEHGIPS